MDIVLQASCRRWLTNLSAFGGSASVFNFTSVTYFLLFSPPRHKCDAECLSSHQFLKEEWVKHKCDVSLVYYFLCCSLSSEKHRKQVSFHFGRPLSFLVMVFWSFSNGLSDPSKTWQCNWGCILAALVLYLCIYTSVNVVPNMWHVGQSEVAGANNVSGIQIYLCNTEYKILMFPARWRESEVVGANSLTLSMLCIRLSPIPPRMKIYILTQKYSSNTHTYNYIPLFYKPAYILSTSSSTSGLAEMSRASDWDLQKIKKDMELRMHQR